ncbi:MAG: DUF3310 domain-containing protein [Bacteroidetes bacterium]|nr:DUF3310 domain-containing protein [Bacteroidota bacterium]
MSENLEKHDPINPSHYKKNPSGLECIHITRHMGFNTGNAVKYLWRYEEKDLIIALKKAVWYLEDLKEHHYISAMFPIVALDGGMIEEIVSGFHSENIQQALRFLLNSRLPMTPLNLQYVIGLINKEIEELGKF